MNGFRTALTLFQDISQVLLGPAGYGIAVWFLVGVFMWSGIVKLRRPALAALAMVDFGVVRYGRPMLGSMLGAFEVFLALTLALRILPQLVVSIATILLWFFVILIAQSLHSGKRFACFCFGDAESNLSNWTLIRTILLALVATWLTVVTVSTNIFVNTGETRMLQALTAVSLLGIIRLVSYIPRLLGWNSDLLLSRPIPSSHVANESEVM